MFTKPIHFYPLGELQLLLATTSDLVQLIHPKNIIRTWTYLGTVNDAQKGKKLGEESLLETLLEWKQKTVGQIRCVTFCTIRSIEEIVILQKRK